MRGNGVYNKGIKVILLLVVLVVVLSVVALDNNAATQKMITVPVTFKQIPEGLIVSEQSIDVMTITLTGIDDDVQTIDSGAFYIDLAEARSGQNIIETSKGRLALGIDAAVVTIIPETVSVWMVPRVSKTLPIKLKMTGIPAKGYRVTETILTPSEVTLSGTPSFINSMNDCMTKPIDVTGLDESIKKEVVADIKLPEGATITPAPVLVEIRIAEKQITRKLKQLPVYGDNSLKKIKVNPPFIDIEVRGVMSALDSLDPKKDIRVSIDLEGLNAGMYVRRAKISLPVDLMLDTADPEIFTISVK